MYSVVTFRRSIVYFTSFVLLLGLLTGGRPALAAERGAGAGAPLPAHEEPALVVPRYPVASPFPSAAGGLLRQTESAGPTITVSVDGGTDVLSYTGPETATLTVSVTDPGTHAPISGLQVTGDREIRTMTNVKGQATLKVPITGTGAHSVTVQDSRGNLHGAWWAVLDPDKQALLELSALDAAGTPVRGAAVEFAAASGSSVQRTTLQSMATAWMVIPADAKTRALVSAPVGSDPVRDLYLVYKDLTPRPYATAGKTAVALDGRTTVAVPAVLGLDGAPVRTMVSAVPQDGNDYNLQLSHAWTDAMARAVLHVVPGPYQIAYYLPDQNGLVFAGVNLAMGSRLVQKINSADLATVHLGYDAAGKAIDHGAFAVRRAQITAVVRPGTLRVSPGPLSVIAAQVGISDSTGRPWTYRFAVNPQRQALTAVTGAALDFTVPLQMDSETRSVTAEAGKATFVGLGLQNSAGDLLTEATPAQSRRPETRFHLTDEAGQAQGTARGDFRGFAWQVPPAAGTQVYQYRGLLNLGPLAPYTSVAGTVSTGTEVVVHATLRMTSWMPAMVRVESPAQVVPGSEFDVTVRVENAAGLYGAQVNLALDPGEATVLGVTPGDLFSSRDTFAVGPQVDSVTNRALYAVTLKGNTVAVAGTGLLATIHLKAASANLSIDISGGIDVLLSNEKAQWIDRILSIQPTIIGPRLAGHLQTTLGDPLWDDQVCLTASESGETRCTATDATGLFAFPVPGDGSYVVWAAPWPYLPAGQSVTVAAGVPDSADYVLSPAFGDEDRDGTVTADDLSGLALRGYDRDLWPGDDGNIVRTGASAERFDLFDLYQAARNVGTSLDPALRLGWIEVTVYDDAAGTVGRQGATVAVYNGGASPVYAAVTDSSGRALIAVAPADYQVVVSATGRPTVTLNATVGFLGTAHLQTKLPPSFLLKTPLRIDLNWSDPVQNMDATLELPGYDGTNTSLIVDSLTPGNAAAWPYALHSGDVTTVGGTETMTIYRLMPGTYYFLAEVYGGKVTKQTLTSVNISGGNGTILTITPPNVDTQGSWFPFAIHVDSSGQYSIVPINLLQAAGN